MIDGEALRHAALGQQIAWMRDGQLDAERLATVYLDAIAASQPRLNAFIAVDRERCLAEARASDAHRAAHGPRALEGIALAIKDNIDVAGWATTAGMATRREAPPASRDAAVIARLRAAGAVFLGKLNMHEAALGADNNNPYFGACQNPHRHGHTPGGSSGGSGCAVAAGLCSAALGTDTMGSVRIPASYCGVYGLKPGFGAVSTRGSVVVSRRLDHIGVLARSAADLAVLLQAMVAFDPDCAESSEQALAEPRATALRLGCPPLEGVALEAEVEDAYRAGLEVLRRLGHTLHPIAPGGLQPGRLRRAGLLVCEADMLVEHAEDWHRQPENFSRPLRTMLRWAEERSAVELASAERQLDAARVQLQQWLSTCDLLVWPTTPQCAFPFTAVTPSNQADFTCMANMAGVPALSLPLPTVADGLPVGLQLIGPRGSERSLIALAGQLSHVAEWR